VKKMPLKRETLKLATVEATGANGVEKTAMTTVENSSNRIF
jgi:hypothetical protein